MERIDLHHHALHSRYLAALPPGADVHYPFPNWSPQASLAMMDTNGIGTALLSVPPPGVFYHDFNDPHRARDLARLCNEESASVIARHPNRFGAFACVPLPNVDDALREAEYALDTLRLDGIGLLSSVAGHYLGDPAFAAFYAELNRRKAIAFVHPAYPIPSLLPGIKVSPAVLEFVFDTTRAVTNLIFTGSAQTYSDISFIFCHGGGTVPFIAPRIAHSSKDAEAAFAALKRFYYDTALAFHPGALRALCELVEPSQIVLGTDFPFAPAPLATVAIREVEAFERFSTANVDSIMRTTAARLLRRRTATDRG